MKRFYFAVLVLCLGATRISAQPQPAWGTSAETSLVVGSFEFQAADAGTTVSRVNNTGDRFANGIIAAPLTLPKGALITGVELQGCNTSPTVPVQYAVARTPPNVTESILAAL